MKGLIQPTLRKLPTIFTVLLGMTSTGSMALGQIVTLNSGNSSASVNLGSQAGMYQWTINGQNQLNQQWFWYRLDGDPTGQHSIDTIGPASFIANANAVDATYTAANFSLEITYTLTGGAIGGSDWTSGITENISVNNQTASPLSFHFYQYSDFALAGSFGGETPSIFQNGGFFSKADVTKGASQLSEAIDQPLANEAEAALGTATLNRLNQGSPYTLNNTLTSGPDPALDATWALQWDFTIGPNSSTNVVKDKKLSVTVFWLALATNPSWAGSVSANPAAVYYPPGATVTLTAVPVIGWIFDHWSGDASGANNPLTISMSADKTITANFHPFVSTTADSGAGSLRQAIADAASSGVSPITFSSGVTGSITLTSGELFINQSLNIVGPGPNALTISGNNASRVFHITNSTSAISNLRIANGHTSSGGGGILLDSGSLSLNNCAVAACYASGGGGATGGGGILALGSTTLSLVGCTLSGNSSPDYGGGLYLFNGASATVVNSTLSGNSTTDSFSDGGGGGIYVINGSILNVTSTTIANNSSATQGGGVYKGFNGTATFRNSLAAGNTAPGGPDCYGPFVSGGYNLIGNSSGSTGFGSAGDQLNLSPLIGPLTDNGGQTFTHALLTGSPAIDKGKSFGVTTDQRGRPRPYDFPSIANAPGGDGSDIGAFEVNPPLLSVARSGGNVVLSWSTNDTGYTLQSNTNLASSVTWSNVPGTPSVVGNQFNVTSGPATGEKFYRLRSP